MRRVWVDFACKECGWRDTIEVETATWELPCECGGTRRRLIQVHFVYPVAQREENISDFKAMVEATEPNERAIRATHFYNYGEWPDKETVRDVKRHKLMVW